MIDGRDGVLRAWRSNRPFKRSQSLLPKPPTVTRLRSTTDPTLTAVVLEAALSVLSNRVDTELSEDGDDPVERSPIGVVVPITGSVRLLVLTSRASRSASGVADGVAHARNDR